MPQRKRLAAALALAACACLAGCAVLGPPAAPAKALTLLPGEILSARTARESISIGKSTKAEVRAALGQAVIVDFDSGYEVWLYREKPPDKAPFSATELVLLFSPSGVLTKTRIRNSNYDPDPEFLTCSEPACISA